MKGWLILMTLAAAAGGQSSGLTAQAADWRGQAGPQSRPDPAAGDMKVLATLDRSHPRLILKDRDLDRLRKLLADDKLLQKFRDDILAKADGYCRQPPIVYKLKGPRLLSVSRDCMNRMYALGLAWRLTGKAEYVAKAKENLLAACQFKDWNPSHFLDTAEMSHAVGIGYDWFFSYLDEPTRVTIRAGLIEHGLKPGLEAYAKDQEWWPKSDFNWNQVCNGGLIAGALAIAETDPEYAAKIIPAAVASLPRALATYDPDGAWPEGPGYWNYATSFTVFGLASLDSALGTDFGLSQQFKGLAQAGEFPLLASGPTGQYFNFADCDENASRGLLPCLFWLAKRYDKPAFAAAERAMAGQSQRKAEPQDFIWYQPPTAADRAAGRDQSAELPLNKLFHGPVEVAVFHGRWDDPAALFVGVKAGYNQVNHGHLDLGTFVIDALGVRWAEDLGADDYNLPNYWGMKKDSTRWTYYRLGSLSHNIPVLDGQNQDVLAKTKFSKFKGGQGSQAEGGLAVLDLTSAYPGRASRVQRGVSVLAGCRAVLVQDEFDLDAPCEVAWGLTTKAEVTITSESNDNKAPNVNNGAKAGGTQAVLTRQGQKCGVTILSPAGAAFTVESVRQSPPQKENQGVSRLMVRLKNQQGPLRIAVLFAPQWPDGPAVQPPAKLLPLVEW